ncbi:protein GID8 homolog isoform X3 [Amaranthus tricolor]|uniref:protein GID8 homolog isoform X3 n=1 Tax=Amaranthus tricolor TaxID=29722 RepID=UPI0025847186|nr:protein GID8 homolog isoform X3 [Amaranthus tricolor]
MMILDTNPKLCFRLQQQKMIELIRRKVEDALELSQEELAPRAEENVHFFRSSSWVKAFLEELERTVTLLVFEDASMCPVGDLDLSQHSKIADELNAAIPQRQNHDKDPMLLSMLKLLIKAQNELDVKSAYPRMTDLSSAKLEELAA